MFNPTFSFVDDIAIAADLINKPHEDYPDRVDSTEEAITELIQLIVDQQNLGGVLLGSSTLHAIHDYIMSDLSDAGMYRTCEVMIGDDMGCTAYLIQNFMDQLLPIQIEEYSFPKGYAWYVESVEDIQEWYKQFEKIHPYSDGNGRVGGVILAAVSYILIGKYCVESV